MAQKELRAPAPEEGGHEGSRRQVFAFLPQCTAPGLGLKAEGRHCSQIPLRELGRPGDGKKLASRPETPQVTLQCSACPSPPCMPMKVTPKKQKQPSVPANWGLF